MLAKCGFYSVGSGKDLIDFHHYDIYLRETTYEERNFISARHFGSPRLGGLLGLMSDEDSGWPDVCRAWITA